MVNLYWILTGVAYSVSVDFRRMRARYCQVLVCVFVTDLTAALPD